ncbi:uncharacterized protein ZC3H3 [Epargyreus clarus]|uniref:uncharacterized protein ZC3H3 n=1 Tax=Epargyreus clarus TaxID=520877 RepID=UPI003C2AD4D0
MDTNINRVYINPNFNRVTKAVSVTNPWYMNNYFHLNPNFTQLPNLQPNVNLNRKIYVNPNFIKSTPEAKLEIKSDNIQVGVPTSSLNNGYVNSTNPLIDNSKPPVTIPPRPSSKSRYSLIRNNDCKLIETERRIQETCTIKISKYKSIPLRNFKNNLQIVKNVSVAKHTHTKGNKFKFIRHDIVPTTSTPVKLLPKPNPLKIRRSVDLNLHMKLKVQNGIRKKNNIPCRLFIKYGKCLRNLYGTCEYLHDRKHVSVCRKFMKGICHDKDCLLSHELSSKKMPTCYFYLKGMCTKEDCPYLHVKLSEKSKICLDFLKGYCDKGDMCVHRHVTPSSNKSTNSKRLVNTFNKHKLNKSNKLNISKSIKIIQSKRVTAQIQCRKVEKIQPSNSKDKQQKEDVDCRYFKEDLRKEDEICEVLKPTRCKLGTLPSFIQL